MKIIRQLASIVALSVFAAGLAVGADNLEEKLGESFYRPEQIKKCAPMLNLTEEQQTTLKNAYEAAVDKVGQLKEQIRAESEKFAALAKEQHLDEKALTAQGDKILDLDREMKHEQLHLGVLIKNTLTPEQQTTMNGVNALDPKLREATKLADKWKADGRDLSKLVEMKTDIEAKLQAGNVKEAEATLDRALDILNERTGK